VLNGESDRASRSDALDGGDSSPAPSLAALAFLAWSSLASCMTMASRSVTRSALRRRLRTGVEYTHERFALTQRAQGVPLPSVSQRVLTARQASQARCLRASACAAVSMSLSADFKVAVALAGPVEADGEYFEPVCALVNNVVWS